MIIYRILEEEGIVVIEPSGPITRSDLEALTRDVDNYVRQKGMIRGMIIHTRSFPRWHDPGAFLKDMKFVFAHQRKIQRVASVTDSKLLFIVHSIARHLFSPQIRHFSYGEMEAALTWIREKR
jgi:SpoIIAA-like